MKALYYGDNLAALRDSIATESVDLIYLDPPFNSNATYNVGLLGYSGRSTDEPKESAYSQEATLHRHDRGRSSSIQIARQDRCVQRRSKCALKVRNGHGAGILIAKSARSKADHS